MTCSSFIFPCFLPLVSHQIPTPYRGTANSPVRPEASRDEDKRQRDESEEEQFFNRLNARHLFQMIGLRDPSLRQVSGPNVWKVMEGGRLWTRYSATGPKTVLLFFQRPNEQYPRGRLSWGQDRQFPDGTLDLKQLTTVWLGCRKGNFLSHGALSADPLKCVTLIGRSAFMLDLEAPTRGVLSMWMFGINYALTSSSKDAVIAVDIKNAPVLSRVGGLSGTFGASSPSLGALNASSSPGSLSPLDGGRRGSIDGSDFHRGDSDLDRKDNNSLSDRDRNISLTDALGSSSPGSLSAAATLSRQRRASFDGGRRASFDGGRRGSFGGTTGLAKGYEPLPPLIIDRGPPPPPPEEGFLVPRDVLYSVHDPASLLSLFKAGFAFTRYVSTQGSTAVENVVVVYDQSTDALVIRPSTTGPSSSSASSFSQSQLIESTTTPSRLPLTEIDQIVLGKATADLQCIEAARVLPSVCVTLIAGQAVWNLASSTPQLLNNWLSALNIVCTEHTPSRLLIFEDPNLPEGQVLKSFFLVSEDIAEAARRVAYQPKLIDYSQGLSPSLDLVQRLFEGIPSLRVLHPQFKEGDSYMDDDDILKHRMVFWLVDGDKSATTVADFITKQGNSINGLSSFSLSPNATLHWSEYPASKRKSAQGDSMLLRDIKLVRCGKQTRTLKHRECETIPDELCFSLIPSNNRIDPLDVICEQEQGSLSRPVLLACLNAALTLQKKKLQGELEKDNTTNTTNANSNTKNKKSSDQKDNKGDANQSNSPSVELGEDGLPLRFVLDVIDESQSQKSRSGLMGATTAITPSSPLTTSTNGTNKTVKIRR